MSLVRERHERGRVMVTRVKQHQERERGRERERYIYICIYTYIDRFIDTYVYICCEVIIWSKFGGCWKLLSGPSWVFGSYYLVQVCVFSL